MSYKFNLGKVFIGLLWEINTFKSLRKKEIK